MSESDGSTAAVKHAVSATVDVETLERYVSHLYAVVNEARWEFTQNGIVCHAMDPASVSLVHGHLDAMMMEDYTAADIVIGVDLHKLKSVLESFEGEVTLTVNAADTTLRLSDGEAEYGIKYLDPDKIREGDEENLWDTSSHVLVPSYKLKRAVTLATEAGDAISFQYDSETGVLDVRNDDGVDTAALDIEVTDTVEDVDGVGLYSKEYLNDILEVIDPSRTVNVILGDEVPVGLEVAAGGVESRFAIAPRIKGADA